MNMDDLDDGAKGQVKKVKALHKCVRWCKANKLADKKSKDFLNTIPPCSASRTCMRPRHWEQLMAATHKKFTPLTRTRISSSARS